MDDGLGNTDISDITLTEVQSDALIEKCMEAEFDDGSMAGAGGSEPDLTPDMISAPAEMFKGCNLGLSNMGLKNFIIGASDGGCEVDGTATVGFHLLKWPEGTVYGMGEIDSDAYTNNMAEASAVVACMSTARDLGGKNLIMVMDSELLWKFINRMAVCKDVKLIPYLTQAFDLMTQFTYIRFVHVRRRFNAAADRLCRDALVERARVEIITPQHLREIQDQIEHIEWESMGKPSQVTQEATSVLKERVLEELKLMMPMIRDRVEKGPGYEDVFAPIGTPTELKTMAFPELIHNTEDLPEWPYVVCPEGYAELRRIASDHHIPWQPERFLRISGKPNEYGWDELAIPEQDVEFTMILLRAMDYDLERLVRAWRGETLDDPRPNKKLSWERTFSFKGDFVGSAAFREICEQGFKLRWKQGRFKGCRPLPRNHPSAEKNACLLNSKLLSQYNQGRMLLVDTSELASKVDGFGTSAFGVVPKAHKPLTHDGRPIHDQSRPTSSSVNDQLCSETSPDATWPGADMVSRRILERARRFGATNLFGLSVDIQDAFHNVPIHASDVGMNGGQFAGSRFGCISLVAIFGNSWSPGAFKQLNVVPQLHQAGSSVVEDRLIPFDGSFYVDDGSAFEPNMGSRLYDSEAHLRAAVAAVFGPNGINEKKTQHWSNVLDLLGYQWNIPNGTVTFAPQKLARTREHLEWFCAQKSVTQHELASVVGRLRHIVTCCKPANALLQSLGGRLALHRRQYRSRIRVNQAQRTEIQWWLNHLEPDLFADLPMEWFGTQPRVDRWLLCFSDKNGVWIVDSLARLVIRVPSTEHRAWVEALSTILQSLPRPPACRLYHVRIQVSSCAFVDAINRCYSTEESNQEAFKLFGLLQLKLRVRVSAVAASRNDCPPLRVSPCPYHVTDPLAVFQSCRIPVWEVSFDRTTSNTRSPPLTLTPSEHTSAISSFGSHSLWTSIYHPRGSITSHPRINPWLCHGSPLSVHKWDTTDMGPATNSTPTRVNGQRWDGPTVFTEVLLCAWVARIWRLLNTRIGNSIINLNPNNHSPWRCCGLPGQSAILPPITDSSFGDASASPSSSCVEAAKCSRTRRVTEDEKDKYVSQMNYGRTASTQLRITGCALETSNSEAPQESEGNGGKPVVSTQSKSDLNIAKETKQAEEKGLNYSEVETPVCARSKRESTSSKPTTKLSETPLNNLGDHWDWGSREKKLQDSLKESLQRKTKIQHDMQSTRLELGEPQHCSPQDTIPWQYDWQEGGTACAMSSIPGFRGSHCALQPAIC